MFKENYSQINRLPFGTIRQDTANGFATAVLVDQFEDEHCWAIVDLWGYCDLLRDEEVEDWPIVFYPEGTTLEHYHNRPIQGTIFDFLPESEQKYNF